MLAYDVFTDDDFTAFHVTEAANELFYIPQLLGSMNIFDVEPIRTDTVGIRKDLETLSLVPFTERGSQETLPDRDTSKLVRLDVPAMRQKDRINAAEVRNLFYPGMTFETGLDRAWDEVDRRQRKMMRKLELTREYLRLHALLGYVRDPRDDSAFIDMFDAFDYTAPSAITFNFTTLVDGALREKFSQSIIEVMQVAGTGAWTPATTVHAICGSTFFHALLKNAEYREAYQGYAGAQLLLTDKTWQSVEVFGITFHNYRGTNDGTTIAVGDDEARFFPVGAEDVMKEFRAPGEDWDDINSEGKEWYSVVSPDARPNMMRFVDVFLSAYTMYLCTKPNMLLRAELA